MRYTVYGIESKNAAQHEWPMMSNHDIEASNAAEAVRQHATDRLARTATMKSAVFRDIYAVVCHSDCVIRFFRVRLPTAVQVDEIEGPTCPGRSETQRHTDESMRP